MTRPGLTDIICILDRSGSMESILNDAIGGFNHFLTSQKQLPGEAAITVVLFDHEQLEVKNRVPVNQSEPMTRETWVPRGRTALLDAIGDTIDRAGKRLDALPEKERPDQVLVCVVTDGFENASIRHSHESILEKIRHQESVYNWKFLFLSADPEAFSTAEKLGIDKDRVFQYEHSGDGTQSAYLYLNQEVELYRKRPQSGKNRH